MYYHINYSLYSHKECSQLTLNSFVTALEVSLLAHHSDADLAIIFLLLNDLL